MGLSQDGVQVEENNRVPWSRANPQEMQHTRALPHKATVTIHKGLKRSRSTL